MRLVLFPTPTLNPSPQGGGRFFLVKPDSCGTSPRMTPRGECVEKRYALGFVLVDVVVVSGKFTEDVPVYFQAGFTVNCTGRN